jgi:phage tail sheath protein FI
VLEQIANLAFARTVFGKAYKVRWAIAGYFSHDIDVQQKLDILNEGTKTTGIIDLKAESVQEAVQTLESMGTKRQLVTPFYGQKWSRFTDGNIMRPLSACIAGHNAYWSAMLGEFGDAYSYGNQPIYGITKIAVPLSYEEGADCDVNTIADAGGAVVFNDEGFELYNFETPNTDETENKLEYVRFFDMINEALQKGAKEYHQRPFTDVMDMLGLKIEQFLGKAVASGAALGFDVWLSDENSGSEIQAGRFYLDYKVGNNPAIRTIILQPWSTSEYADQLVKSN